MKVDECIFFQLAKAAQTGSEFWGSRVTHLGVTAVQALVLNFLREQEGTTAQHLGQRAGLTSATMTGVLDRLERLGLVERRDHPEDRRALQIWLTAAGTGVAQEIGRIFVDANQEFLAGFTKHEVATLRAALVRIRQEREGRDHV